jgi:hypothetical protein
MSRSSGKALHHGIIIIIIIIIAAAAELSTGATSLLASTSKTGQSTCSVPPAMRHELGPCLRSTRIYILRCYNDQGPALIISLCSS